MIDERRVPDQVRDPGVGDGSQMQNILLDAFYRGIVTTNNFGQARRIISARAKHTKKRRSQRTTVPPTGQRHRGDDEGENVLTFAKSKSKRKPLHDAVVRHQHAV